MSRRLSHQFERFVALRYLVSRRRVGLITIISAISIVGITVGVAALVVVLSVFNGFNTFAVEQLVSVDPHVRLIPNRPGATVEPQRVIDSLGIDYVSAGGFVEGRTAITREGATQVAMIRGVEPRRGGGEIAAMLEDAAGSVEGPSILLGSGLAGRLRAYTGDTVAMIGREGLELALTQVAQPMSIEARVASTFSLNQEYDARTAFVPIDVARLLFSLESGAMGVEIVLEDFRRAPEVAEQLRTRFGEEFRIETWQDLHSDLYGAMELERWAAFVIVLSIIVVAVFNVLGSLTMTVIEKRRDIGLLKSLGATPRRVARIFLIEGAIVGIVGTLSGIAIGLGLCLVQQEAKLVSLDSGRYLLDALPVIVDPFDVFLVGSVALVLSGLATIYPALRAARTRPADALRWE